MTVRNHEQFTGPPPAGDRSPDHGTGTGRDGPSADAPGGRSWDAPVGVWGGKTYTELYVEYAPAARRLALSMVPPDVADDVVAEAFAKVLAVIRAGGGPSHAFQGYLLTAVRHQATDWQRSRRRLTAVADMDVEADDLVTTGRGRVSPGIGSAAETQVAARDEARLVARAFGRLPSRWRAVLWELEVEGKAPAAVAPMFGLSANGVSALAMRAREGLRQAYLDEHVGTNIPEPCRAFAAEFGAGARGRLSQRRRAAMQEHLTHCRACQDLFTELTELNSRLGTILTPAALAAASAFMHSGRHAALIRTSLSAPWRSWRFHPVTTTAGAAASVVVAGGMLLAVNVTPFPGSPAHAGTSRAAARPATASAATPGSVTHRRGQGGSGGGGSPAGTGSPAAPLTAAAAAAGGAYSSLPAGPVTTGTVGPGISAAGGGASASGAASGSGGASGSTATGTLSGGAAASPGQTITITAGNTLTGLTSTAGAAAWGVTSTVGTAVPGVTSTVGGVVSGATGTVSGAVSGVTSTVSGVVSGTSSTVGDVVSGATGTVSGAVSGVTSTAGAAVSGATSTAGAAVSGAASTVSGVVTGVTSTVGGAVSGATGTVGGAVAGVTSTAGAAVSGATSTAGNVASGTTSTIGSAVSGVASTTGSAVSGATNTVSSVASTVAATTTSATSAATPAASTPAASSADTGATTPDPASPASMSNGTAAAASPVASTAVAATTSIVNTVTSAIP